MRAAGLFFLLSCLAQAQNVRRIELVADTTRVVCGGVFKVRAIAYDPDNKPVAAQFQYTTNLAEKAPVTADGTVTAKVPGVVRVKATLWGSSFANEISVQSVPARMEITPGPVTVLIGERQQFSFKAYDANGQEVTTPAVTWSVLHGNGSSSVAARVTQQGLVTGLAESDLFLQAGFVYEPYMPGFQRQSYASIPVKVRPRESYRLRKIRLPDENPGGLYRGLRLSQPVANESGQFLQASAVSAGNAASLLWDGEKYRVVLATGRNGLLPASPILEIHANALNDRDEVAIQAGQTAGGTVLYRGSTTQQTAVLSDGMALTSGGLVSGGFTLSRFSLNNEGHLLLLVNYAPRFGAASRQGLFRFESDGSTYLVADSSTVLPGLSTPVRFDSNMYGATTGRNAWFLATSGGATALYRRRGFEPIERVLGTGDELEGSRIRTVLGDQAFWMSRASGDIVVLVQLENGQTWMGFLPSGDAALATWSRLGGGQRICGSRPDGRVWMYGAPFSQTTGLYLLQDGRWTRYMQESNTRLDGETILTQFGCFVDAADRPYALLNTARDYFVLTRFDGTDATVLARGGDPIDGALRPVFTGFVQGKRDGNVYLSGGAWSSHVWEVNGSTVEPVLKPGDMLREGTWFSTGGVAVNDSGKLVTTASNRYDTLGVQREAESEVLIANNLLLEDGTRLFGGFGARINRRGSTLTIHGSSRGDTRMALNRDGRLELILSNGSYPEFTFSIDGLGTAVSWGDYALDDSDRVLALINSREGKSAWCLWEGGVWRIAFQPAEKVGQRTVTGYNSLRASASSFYLRFNATSGGSGIAVYDVSGPRIVLDPDDPASNGNVVNFTSIFQTNLRGEFVVSNAAFGNQSISVLRNGSMRHVYSLTGATREGDVLFRIMDMIMMNDGRVYILATTPEERQVLYEATPID